MTAWEERRRSGIDLSDQDRNLCPRSTAPGAVKPALPPKCHWNAQRYAQRSAEEPDEINLASRSKTPKPISIVNTAVNTFISPFHSAECTKRSIDSTNSAEFR